MWSPWTRRASYWLNYIQYDWYVVSLTNWTCWTQINIAHVPNPPPPPPTPHDLNTGRDEDEFSEVENYQRQMLEQGQVKEKARVRERDLKSVRRGGGNDLFGYGIAGTNNSSSNIQVFLFHMVWIFHRLHTGVRIISSCGSSWRTKTITLFTKKSTVYCINRWPLLTYFTILTHNVISLLTLWLLTFNRLCVKELT